MNPYPLELSIEYPDRDLDRVSTLLRILYAIPIAIVLGTVSGATWQWSSDQSRYVAAGAGGLLFFGPLLMIVFRQKYPRWWFDWNLELLRFTTRVYAYFALMDDRYPSTTEQQSVRVDVPYPDVPAQLNRLLPLVKWLLALPHYIVLAFLAIGAFFAILFAWFVILFTGRYPRGVFDFVEGVIRWGTRVEAYAFLLVTDEYPPFRLT